MYEDAPVVVANAILAEFVVIEETFGVGLLKVVPAVTEAKVNVVETPGSEFKNATPSPFAIKLTL